MLTPNEYDHLCDQLMQIYWALDDAIIADITRRLMKTGGDYLPDMAVIQAERMQQAGLLYEDILAEVAKRSGMTQRQVAKTFERAGVQSIRNDNRAYRAAGLEGIVKMSDACMQTLNAGYAKCSGELQNLTLTTANTAQTAYLQACDLAYMQVSTGTLDYQTAIRRAVRSAADQGAFVLYPTGHRDRLDVAVRRSVLTGVGQTVRKLSLINANDMDCDLMEITAHAGARPTHAAWQGKIVSRSGRRGYLSLKDIGWGEPDGFGGINCRHDWLPFFEGISHRAYTDADLQALNEPYIDLGDGKLYTDYEVSQMQRALEREVRKCKRWVSGAAAGVDSAQDEIAEKFMKAELTDASVELKKAEKELQDFCNQIDVPNDKFRTEVNGFGRSEAQRAVWADKNAFVESMRQKGVNNPPKSIAIFEKMQYNDPKEYAILSKYLKSVDSGMMSPLVGYDKYKEYHKRIANEVIGLTASNGIKISGQSDHFLERVFGTISDPSHGGVSRSGVEIEDIIDALQNGTVRNPKEEKDKSGNVIRRSQAFYTKNCLVTVNPDTGVLIQCNPY